MFLLNLPLKFVLSEFVRRTRMPLARFVELVRMQTSADYRPNKDIVPAILENLCSHYKHRELLLRIAAEGVRVNTTSSPPRRASPPCNHGSASSRVNVLRKNLRKEQDLFRCLVLDLDLLSLWPELHISPFGVVDKADGDPLVSGRTIHDLSYPEGFSINDVTDQASIERSEYQHCSVIAGEVLRLKAQHSTDSSNPPPVVIMAGDVASAFRSVSIHSDSLHLFCGAIPEDNAPVVELAAPFGWTGSPGFYEIFGGAISYIHGTSTTTSSTTGHFKYHWVDDHVCVAFDKGEECDAVERSLRFAMTAVLGAPAINEDKFTGWHRSIKVLGLLFDTSACTIAMPPVKIDKACRLVQLTYHNAVVSAHQLHSLLGSLRHVATCIRAARPFLQRLRSRCNSASRHRNVVLTDDMRHDLVWR